MKKREFMKIESEVVNPIIMEVKEGLQYIQECFNGMSEEPNGEVLKITKIMMTDDEFDKLPEFEG